MTILLAYSSGSTVHDESTTFTDLLPIGLCSLHALLRSRGYQAHLANLSQMDQQQIRDLLLRLKPNLIGLSQWTHNRHATIALAQVAKQILPASTIVLGGGHATHQAESILMQHAEVDLIVTGEGEQTLLELVETLQQGHAVDSVAGLAIRQGDTVLRTSTRPRIHDLDQLPYPASFLHEAHGVDLDLQPQFISTSRGCPSACRFCASPSFWGRAVRTRSPVSVVDEFLFQRQQFGMVYLSLRDDTFTADRQRTIELCRLLLERRVNMFWNCQTRVETVDEEMLTWMKRAGCECIQLGVESGSPRILHELGKKITPEQIIQAADAVHRVGLNLSVYLIAGVPGETAADQQATRDLLARITPHDLQVAPLAYYPGTALFTNAVRHGRVSADLFDSDRRDALLARASGPQQAARLVKETGIKAPAVTGRSIAELRQRIGYCAVNCMQAGDYYARQGAWKKAQAAYQEIASTEPDHPWGWLLLAELYDETGQEKEAVECYQEVLRLVPQHRQALRAVQK